MTREQLAKIRQRANDPTLKWNILMAQSDREALLAYVDDLKARIPDPPPVPQGTDAERGDPTERGRG